MHVLLVEDDRSLSIALTYKLKKAGMEVTACPEGQEGLEEALSGRYDLIVLDRMLPGLDGASIVRKLRAKKIASPVLMLTAMDGIQDRVEGLNAGADDYLVKPFAADELLARINALMRRPEKWLPGRTAQAFDLVLDMEAMVLAGPSDQIPLSGREGRLMELFLNNAARVFTRNMLMDRVWGGAAVEDGNLDIYVHFLRKKLRSAGSSARIETVRGVGYRLAGRREDGGA